PADRKGQRVAAGGALDGPPARTVTARPRPGRRKQQDDRQRRGNRGPGPHPRARRRSQRPNPGTMTTAAIPTAAISALDSPSPSGLTVRTPAPSEPSENTALPMTTPPGPR